MGWRLTRAAEQDVVDIYRYGAATFGAAQADAYHAALEATFALLAARPELARERTEIDPPVRIHPCGAHIVVYIIESGTGDPDTDVLIVRVRHGREDWADDPGDAGE